MLEHAAKTRNLAETCRTFGINRTRYRKWKNVADAYGLDALWPKDRRRPKMPDATPTHVVERLLTLAVFEPTIRCRQYADRLFDQGREDPKDFGVDPAQAVMACHAVGLDPGLGLIHLDARGRHSLALDPLTGSARSVTSTTSRARSPADDAVRG